MRNYTTDELLKAGFRQAEGRTSNYLALTFGDGRLILAKLFDNGTTEIHGAIDTFGRMYDTEAINWDMDEIKTVEQLEQFLMNLPKAKVTVR